MMLARALLVACAVAHASCLRPLSAVADDNECALYLAGPGRTSAYDYNLNLLRGNVGYDGQHTCITYDAVNQAYLEARKRIVVAQPKGDWKPEDYASVGELVLDISISLARTYGLTYEEIEKGLPLIDTSRTLIREVCPPVFSHVECRAGKYRRLDGLCNNLEHPTWGATNAPFQRLIGPLFSDGINSPRISHTGRDLPLSRVVSRTMHPDEGFHDHAGTIMVIAWGQFMDHDYTLTGTPLDPRNRNDPEECCKRPLHLKHPYCNEIRIPDDDYFYRLWGVKCIDFVRAFPSPRPGCRLGSRIPYNTLTGAIDGNTVYGVTDKFARKLRTGYGGLLRMNPVFEEYGLKDLLPLKLDIPDEGCTRPNKNMYCFEAGEIRVNEQLILTVMHTLMAREHNRVAKGLAGVNPHWDDETLYQEARRINIAEIQHITYNEFLPILLGKDVMEKFGLVLEKESFWDGYDPTVNPDVIASFASAAYRFGHSLLPTAVERWSKAHKFIASKRLSDLIRRPYDLYRAGVLDEYVMGLLNQVAQAMDDSITQEVTNHLFKKVGARFGMDLVSFNMQRGREFGIPGYMEFRKFCGLNGANTFQDLFGSMPNETVRKYETIFEHPIDVDLWSGGVSERPLPGSMLGPTFACIIATQFSYSRRGDRFWYELPNQPSSFTPEQLVEIRKSRMARVICDNTDIIDTVQIYPMVLPDHELNPRVPCRSGIIPSMDFSKWAETPPFPSAAKQFDTNNTKFEDKLTLAIVLDKNNETLVNHTANSTVLVDSKQQVTTQSTILSDDDVKKINLLSQASRSVINDAPSKVNQSDILSKPKPIGDHVMNYIYKDIKGNKNKGHFKNSLKRRRRASDQGHDSRARKQDSRSKPKSILFDYETIHKPGKISSAENKQEFYQKKNLNLIDEKRLANFDIKTEHGVSKIREPSNENESGSEENSSNDNDNNDYIQQRSQLSARKHIPINSTESPKIQDVDLDEFTHERIQVKDDGVVEAIENDTSEVDDSRENNKSSPNNHSETELKELPINSVESTVASSLEDTDSTEQQPKPININDGEIKPVVEIRKEDSSEDISSISSDYIKPGTLLESIKSQDIFGDQKTLQNNDKTSLKQQFERIPLNYTHDKANSKPKVQEETDDQDEVTEFTYIPEDNEEFTRSKEEPYDDHLSFKFGDVSIKLPEIKFPEDILSYKYEEKPSKQKDQVKKQTDQNDNSEENESLKEVSSKEVEGTIEESSAEDKNESEESSTEEKNENRSSSLEDKNESEASSKENYDDSDQYLHKKYYKRNEDYKKKRQQSDSNENEDLYEKFVRERFGKQGTFGNRGRSEKLELKDKPDIELHNRLQKILKKARTTEVEAEKSGDPNAGFMWTLEYGQRL